MIIEHYKQKFAELLAPKTGMAVGDIIPLIEQPPQADMGDLAFPCFALSKTLRKAPPMIAAEIAEGLNGEGLEVKAMGPYVNAFISKQDFTKHVLEHTTQNSKSKTEKVLLEYMSGNPNKPLHVGHARNVCLGDALRRIFAKQ